ncbi:hypothetical protein FAM09_22260 [Niastella caeni]|uniref:Lipoprotein n=1 Tax=Niastella caeni TaxID=2569763 RepID=A0A4S8HLC3_9BACT|nr:hypothetical protein [Niastella caeni]THU36110.1 hypothetical protein FAM09_22260 [Niastella caeni]
MKILIGSSIFLIIVIVIACSTAYKATDFSVRDVNSVTENWPANTKDASTVLIGKFGLPDEVTSSSLVWNNKGVWKKTVLMRDGIPHDFPVPHTDYLMQTINYKVPVEKYTDLARYDGSVIVERTRGTLSARCDREEMNFLSLNLAHDIITGKKTVDEARDYYARAALQFKEGSTGVTGRTTDPTARTTDPAERRTDTTARTTDPAERRTDTAVRRTEPIDRTDTTMARRTDSIERRAETTERRTDLKEGGIDPYLQGLQFTIPQGDTGDRDVPANRTKMN